MVYQLDYCHNKGYFNKLPLYKINFEINDKNKQIKQWK